MCFCQWLLLMCRVVVPRSVMDKVTKPRRASSLPQPISGPLPGWARRNSGSTSRSTFPLVPGMQTIPGIDRGLASTGTVKTPGTSSPKALR